MLPHISNSQAGVNQWDPVHKSLFEVSFTLPEAINADFGGDVELLKEHVLTVNGLDAMYKAPEVDSQKFMGTDRSYIKPTVGDTKAAFDIEFSLNMRGEHGTDNYILKLFRAWAALGYDMTTGQRRLKKDYTAKWLKVSFLTREGRIYREIVFKDVMIAGPLEYDGSLDYSADDAVNLKVKFVSDWWQETMA